ncbi:MAG TPA: DUF4349 domain-containing protein [Nakamurella sp.]
MRGRRTGRAALRFGGPALLGALAMSVVVACSSGSASSSGGDDAAQTAPQATAAAPGRATAPEAEIGAAVPGAADSAGGSAPGSAAGSAGQQLATVPVDGTKVIKTADLSVRLEVAPVPATDDAAADREANAKACADTVAATTGSIRGIASTAGGFVAGADGGGSQMSITLRVPADQYDGVLDKIAGLGPVTNRTESSQDVTAQIVDVNSRVASMTASVARVRVLLDQATSVADIISIESELATREADLESLQQQQAYLQGQVAMSTVTVTLSAVTLPTPGVVEPEPDNGFVAAVKAGWDNLLSFLSWLGVLIGGLLPWLPLIAIVVGLVWWAVRRLRRRGRSARVEPDPSTQPTTPDRDQESREPAGVG